MNKKDLLKLTGNALTAAAFREAGLSLVPINPDGSLAEDALKDYIAKGQPNGEFFGAYLLVSPEEMEERRRAKPTATRFDPISGEPEAESGSADWDALAPITVLGGASVSAADLAAYATAKGLLSTEITSTLALMMLPKGATPISPPRVLEAAARRWPYDPQAARIAADRRRGATRTAAPVIRPSNPTDGSPAVPLGPSKEARLCSFLVSAFAADEFRRFLLFGGFVGMDQLPGDSASRAHLVGVAVECMQMSRTINRTFFEALLLARPRRGNEIADLRAEFGC